MNALAEQISPVVLAHERVLPVGERMQEILPGLVRGRVLSCCGHAATTIALSLAAEATAAGSWMVVVDLPTIGVDAAAELGVALDRLVAVRSSHDRSARRWADVVAAAADGVDLVLTSVPPDVRPAWGRSVVTRVRRSGSVLIVLGDPGVVGCDGVVQTSRQRWDGLGDGHGHLRGRSVDVHVGGRRLPDHRVRLQLAG